MSGKKIFKILGAEGRITIPYEFRVRGKFNTNDVVSFEEKDGVIILKREKLCNKNNRQSLESVGKTADYHAEKEKSKSSVGKLLDSFSIKDQYSALVHLTTKFIRTSGVND